MDFFFCYLSDCIHDMRKIDGIFLVHLKKEIFGLSQVANRFIF